MNLIYSFITTVFVFFLERVLRRAFPEKQKNKRGKNYVQKLEYHSKRQSAPGRFGLEFGSPKQCYSMGFREAFTGRNNEGAIRGEFGKRSSNSYAIGYKRGKKAAHDYFSKTGKQPFSLALEVGRKI